MEAVTYICTDDEIQNQTFRSLMDSKLFKNLSTFQQQSAYVTYQEKSLTRWNALKQASEQFVQSIMLRRVDQILSDVWRSPIWSERKKKNKLERLSFREQSDFVSQITDHIMTVVGQLTPQEEEEETQNDIDHYEWTAKLT
eukprot:UN13086